MQRAGKGASVLFVLLVFFFMAGSAEAQSGIEVEVDSLECIPIAENGLAWATVKNNRPDTQVRLYFRRLHEEVEDFYWTEMVPDADNAGRYWGLFPEAANEDLEQRNLAEDPDDRIEQFRDRDPDDDEDYLWAWWWRDKIERDDRDPNDDLDEERIRERAGVGRSERREWLEKIEDPELEEFLEEIIINEPAEFFVAVHDRQGRRLVRSEMKIVEVVKEKDCDIEMTPQQLGVAENLTVGESAEWQRGERVFHWLCDDIVSRVDPFNVLRADGFCRACIIAWWQKKPLLAVPPIIACAGLCSDVLDGDDDPPMSPSNP